MKMRNMLSAKVFAKLMQFCLGSEKSVEKVSLIARSFIVTITFKRPDSKSGTIKINYKGEDVIQKTDSAEEHPLSTP